MSIQLHPVSSYQAFPHHILLALISPPFGCCSYRRLELHIFHLCFQLSPFLGDTFSHLSTFSTSFLFTLFPMKSPFPWAIFYNCHYHITYTLTYLPSFSTSSHIYMSSTPTLLVVTLYIHPYVHLTSIYITVQPSFSIPFSFNLHIFFYCTAMSNTSFVWCGEYSTSIDFKIHPRLGPWVLKN